MIYNGNPDYYGRFDTSWDFGDTDDSRLSNWLDPINSGIETLDMISVEKPSGVPLIPKQKVDIYYQLTNNTLNIVNDSNKRIRYGIYNMLGQQLKLGILSSRSSQKISLSTASNGIYFVHITKLNDGSTFTKKIMISK